MQIRLNGEDYQTGDAETVTALLEQLEARGRRVAVMVNEEIVKRDRWPERALRPGDEIEVIQMVGGG